MKDWAKFHKISIESSTKISIGISLPYPPLWPGSPRRSPVFSRFSEKKLKNQTKNREKKILSKKTRRGPGHPAILILFRKKKYLCEYDIFSYSITNIPSLYNFIIL